MEKETDSSLEKLTKENSKYKLEIKSKEKTIASLIADMKRFEKQQKLVLMIQSRFIDQKKIIEDLNEELVKKDAINLSLKYAQYE